MGALTFDALLKNLKRGSPDPVYYLHGDEDVLKNEAITALIARAVDESARDFNVDRRDAADLDPASLRALLDTPPMLAATRAVVLRGVEDVKKTSALYRELNAYLANPNPTTVLVLVQGVGEAPDAGIARNSTAVAVEALSAERVVRWVAHHASKIGLTLEDGVGEFLVDAVGTDLGALSRELEKLAALATSRAATRNDVSALVGARHGETLGDLINAALTPEPAAAARLVEGVLQQSGMSGVRVVNALGTALIGTALARAELDRGVAAGRLPDTLFRHMLATKPFGLGNWKEEAARWARWARGWTAAGLRRAIRRALVADRALKSTTVSDDSGILTELLLTLSVAVEEAA